MHWFFIQSFIDQFKKKNERIFKIERKDFFIWLGVDYKEIV